MLAASDVHVADRLAALSSVTDDLVRLGVAFAAGRRAWVTCASTLARSGSPRAASRMRTTDVDALPWPDPDAWLAAMRPALSSGTIVRCISRGTILYLNRLWVDELQVASDLLELASAAADGVDEALLAKGLARMFPPAPLTQTRLTSRPWRLRSRCCGESR